MCMYIPVSILESVKVFSKAAITLGVGLLDRLGRNKGLFEDVSSSWVEGIDVDNSGHGVEAEPSGIVAFLARVEIK